MLPPSIIFLIILGIILGIAFLLRERWIPTEAFALALAPSKAPQGPIHFLSTLETAQLIIDDADGYIAKMTISDLTDRGLYGRPEGLAHDRDAYRRASALSATAYIPPEKEKLTAAAKKADSMLAATEPRAYPDIDLKAVAAMKWTFAMVRDRTYENGRPHFRIINKLPVIFFSDTALAEQMASRRQLQNTLLYFKFEAWAAINRESLSGYCQDGVIRYLQGGRVGTLGTPIEVGQEHVFEWSPWNHSSSTIIAQPPPSKPQTSSSWYNAFQKITSSASAST